MKTNIKLLLPILGMCTACTYNDVHPVKPVIGCLKNDSTSIGCVKLSEVYVTVNKLGLKNPSWSLCAECK